MEKNIHKFIIHVVNNLFPLYEYSEGEIKKLMDKFKEEADDLNIQITDNELKKYIERFDQLKDSSKIEDKVLRNWPLPKLIKLVTSSEGAEADEETGPDVIYSGNGITVYSGGSEDLCRRHRDDVPWCITKASFGNYRFSEGRRFPSFYLIKNDSPEYINDDKLAFVAIQVRDTTDESKKYIWTPKDNSPNESKQMSWSELTSAIPWLNSIPNVKNMLKYVPLSTTEKATNVFSKTAISIRQWVSLPFAAKKQYLVARQNKESLFSDISNDEFVSQYLPQYPQLATFIAVTPGVLNTTLLLKHLDKFSNQDRKSITANLRDSVEIKELSRENLPFAVKKLLVALNKWDIKSNERLYITKDGNAIVKLTFGDDIKAGVYTAEDDYPDIKLNARTSKYLTEYPEIDKIPFNTLIKLTNDEVIDKSFIEKIIVKAEEDPNSAISVKDGEDGKILLDSNSFTSYKIKDGKISSIPFDSEEVQNILSNETENINFQDSAVNIIFNKEHIPNSIDKEAFLNILKNIPYNKRTREGQVILVNSESTTPIFTMNALTVNVSPDYTFNYGSRTDNWSSYEGTENTFNPENWKTYFDYLRSKNIGFNDIELERFANRTSVAPKFIEANPPMVANSTYLPVVIADQYVLLNKQNPAASKKIGRHNIIKANISPAVARQILGGAAPTTPAPTTPRVPRTQAAPAQAAPAAGANVGVDNVLGDNGLTAGFNMLPTNIKGRIRGGEIVPYNRRNSAVDAIGRVRSLVQNGQSKFYIIRLTSGTVIGFATIQPDARHYIVTTTRAYTVPRVGELSNVMRTNNISEGVKTVLRAHAAAYPKEANKIKKILQKLKIK